MTNRAKHKIRFIQKCDYCSSIKEQDLFVIANYSWPRQVNFKYMPTRKEILRQLGARLAKERRKRGITLEKLAYEMGMSKGNLSNIENGKRDPRYITLKAIATGMGVNLSHLLKELD